MDRCERASSTIAKDGSGGRGGQLEDLNRFGAREHGPVRLAMQMTRRDRLRRILADAGESPAIVELGCGGSPDSLCCELAESYTGVDFSVTGLQQAAAKLHGVPHRFILADIAQLPLDAAAFDILYCKNVLLHNSTPAQQRIIAEAMRVLRPGGIGLFVLNNPFPLLFPMRFAVRCIALVPGLGAAVYQLRRRAHLMRGRPDPSPLPYHPKRIGWYRRQFSRYGRVDVLAGAMASTWFNQCVSEHRWPGRWLWRVLQWLESKFPRGAAYMGNYTVITVVRAGTSLPRGAAVRSTSAVGSV